MYPGFLPGVPVYLHLAEPFRGRGSVRFFEKTQVFSLAEKHFGKIFKQTVKTPFFRYNRAKRRIYLLTVGLGFSIISDNLFLITGN